MRRPVRSRCSSSSCRLPASRGLQPPAAPRAPRSSDEHHPRTHAVHSRAERPRPLGLGRPRFGRKGNQRPRTQIRRGMGRGEAPCGFPDGVDELVVDTGPACGRRGPTNAQGRRRRARIGVASGRDREANQRDVGRLDSLDLNLHGPRGPCWTPSTRRTSRGSKVSVATSTASVVLPPGLLVSAITGPVAGGPRRRQLRTRRRRHAD